MYKRRDGLYPPPLCVYTHLILLVKSGGTQLEPMKVAAFAYCMEEKVRRLYKNIAGEKE
jgi:hypothetical protein